MDGPGGTTPPLQRAAYADVLPTKLVPPRIPPSYVVRPRLHDQLQDGTERALTVVSAGAGWGKTLATAHWATTGTPPAPSAGCRWTRPTTSRAGSGPASSPRCASRCRSPPTTR